MGDHPWLNYFIMAWKRWSTVEPRGVLPPALQNNPDNLVNKGTPLSLSLLHASLNERHVDKGREREARKQWGETDVHTVDE